MGNYTEFRDRGQIHPDNLFSGEFPRVMEKVTLESGKYQKGTILGKIKSTQKYVPLNLSAEDGSQIPEAILAEDVESGSEVEAIIYLTGEFNASSLVVNSGSDVASMRDALRAKSIFIKNN
ncbi:MAG: head decoration protein [Alphaproteobacteria bacterium]